jgi:GNAT superfamily N-acetyltransferase
MEIREAVVGDVYGIGELLRQLDYPGTELFLATRIRELLDHPDARLIVADNGQQLLGLISLHFIPQLGLAGDFCRISYFCVAETARHVGIGTLLETKAVEVALARGCDRLEVHCHSRRTAAHRFYQRRGYQASPQYFIKNLAIRPGA